MRQLETDSEAGWTRPQWWNERCAGVLDGRVVESVIPGTRGAIEQAYTCVLPFTLRTERREGTDGGEVPAGSCPNDDDRRVVLKRVLLDPSALDSPRAPKGTGGGPSGNLSSRNANRAKSYLVEASFYKHCGPRLNQVGARVPAVLHCDDSRAEAIEMVLEDVTRHSSGWNETTDRSDEQALVLDEAKALCALEWAAALHSEFWGQRADGVSSGLWESGGYWGLDKRRKELAAMEAEWEKTVASFEAEYPRVFEQDSIRGLAHRLKKAAAALSNEISADRVWESSQYATVLHGDFKTANMFFTKCEKTSEDRVAVCDFQWAGCGLGVLDVVYLLYTSCEPELIAHKEEELLRHYHSELLRRLEALQETEAAQVYPWELFMHHYETAYLDYVRFLLCRMWGSVSPETCRANTNSLNIGMHKRSAEHMVAMVVKADRILSKLEANGWPQSLSGRLNAPVSSDIPVVLRVLNSCADLACRAGEVIRQQLEDAGGRMSVNADKAEFGYGEPDPQTLADLAAERFIINGLAEAFPDLKVIGEEGEAVSVETRSRDHDQGQSKELHFIPAQASALLAWELQDARIADMCVWVDPLDGTQEFVDGNFDRVTVLLGVSVKGKPAAGVILQPFVETEFGGKGRLLWGAPGLGVWDGDGRGVCAASRLPVSPCSRTVVATTRSHPSEAVQAAADALSPHETCRVGGAGSKVVMILEGRISHWVYPRKGTKRWDTAAPEALLRAAGGFCVDAQGRAYDYSADCEPRNDDGVIAGGSAHAWEQCARAYGWKEQFPV